MDTALSCLAVVLQFLNQPSDIGHLQQRFAAPGGSTDVVALVRAAQALGLKARLTSTAWDRLDRTTLPAIAEIRDGKFLVLAKATPEKILVLDPRERSNKILDRAGFEAIWTRRLVLITTDAQLAGSERHFDFTWFIPALLKYRRLFFEVLAGSFFLQLFALASPLLFQVVVDKVIPHNSLSTLDVLIFGMTTIAVFEAVLGGLRSYIFSHTASRVDVELGAHLFGHLLSLPMLYFQARRAGDSVARARELENVRSFLTSSAVTAVVDLAFTAVFIAVMFLFSATLTAIVLASLPLYAVISVIVTPILRRRLDEKFKRGAENHAFLVETVSGVETIKSMAVEGQMQRKWEDQLGGYVRAGFSAGNLAAQAGQAIGFLNKIVMAVTLWLGTKLVIHGDLTIGELIAVNMLATRVSMPVLRLSQLWQDFQQFRISIDRLGDIFNARPETAGIKSRLGLERLKGHINFENVTFRYRPDGPQILKDVSLEIPAGQVIGIVGPSGSGKSTLAKLVHRLYIPEHGRILIDGLDIALLDPPALRRQIGVVLQENVLFSGTIRDNIAFSNPHMGMDAVIAAAKLSGAHAFILGLERGYDTVVGERGSTLSGGQRQRIAIARAVAINPSILIFDEATESLDAETEAIIQSNLPRICQGRTMIIIAHRLSAVRVADRIITIEDGQIVEDGTHEALLRQGGRYSALYRRQMGIAHDI